jgi:hypothetical protein
MKTKLSLVLTAAVAVVVVGSASVTPVDAADRGAKISRAPLIEAPNSVTDPKRLRYIIPGVRNTAAAGTSTYIHCVNLSSVDEVIQFNLYSDIGSLISNNAFTLTKFDTIEVATRGTSLFDNEDNNNLAGGVDIDTGMMRVLSTTSKVACTAALIDSALNDIPRGFSLHVVRVNQEPGWQE